MQEDADLTNEILGGMGPLPLWIHQVSGVSMDMPNQIGRLLCPPLHPCRFARRGIPQILITVKCRLIYPVQNRMAKGGKSKNMGIVALFVVLIVVVALSTVLLRYLFRVTSGFTDLSGISSSNQTPIQDPNTAYLCNSPNGNGVPCKEGEFCDGTTQRCVNKTAFGGQVPEEGYYS